MSADCVTPATTGRRQRELTGRIVLICLLSFFAVVGGMNAVMIKAAVSTFGGIETQNSYQAGLAFSEQIAASHAQDALHWRVDAKVVPNATTTLIELTVTDDGGLPPIGLQAAGLLVHPTDKRADHALSFEEQERGKFRGHTEAAHGQWILEIELSRSGERLFRSRNRVFLR
jgi:nitrogen fixation protein FixH